MIRFQRRSALQREVLSALVNKILLALLLDQFTVLVDLKLPLFSADTLKALQVWASGSEVLRVVRGKNTAGWTAANQSEAEMKYRAEFQSMYSQLEPEVVRLRSITCALLSIRLHQSFSPRGAGDPALRPLVRDDLPSGPIPIAGPVPVPIHSSAAALYQAARASQQSRQDRLLQQRQYPREDPSVLEDEPIGVGGAAGFYSNKKKKLKKRRRFDSTVYEPAVPPLLRAAPVATVPVQSSAPFSKPHLTPTANLVISSDVHKQTALTPLPTSESSVPAKTKPAPLASKVKSVPSSTSSAPSKTQQKGPGKASGTDEGMSEEQNALLLRLASILKSKGALKKK